MSVADTYRTIEKISEGYITEQRSKFISYAIPVSTPEEAKEYVDLYRKQYYDARHVCWAYMLEPERTVFRVNDDGEPSSTAGKPILGVINSNNLTNILIVVIRYFGGVKLGTGGLIVAYRAAAQDAVANAIIIEKTIEIEITVSFEYPFMNSIMRIVKDHNLSVIRQDFNNNCILVLKVGQSEAEQVVSKLQKVETASVSTD